MSEATNVSRSVDTELAPDELWALVVDGDAWAAWMVDEADVTVEPGAGGRVVDDGVGRTVHIDRLDDDGDARRVGFTWWPDDRPDLVSAVELVVLPAATGSRLRVHETYASTASSATLAWDVRLLLLAVRALAVHV
jgi:uncharacterized protein YndB with AHSA1/START domain